MLSEKVSAVMEMIEQMIETNMRIRGTGRQIEDVRCRVCNSQNETVQHWLTGCTPLAAGEYTETQCSTDGPCSRIGKTGLANQGLLFYH